MKAFQVSHKMTENAIDVQTKVKYVNESLEDEEDFHFL